MSPFYIFAYESSSLEKVIYSIFKLFIKFTTDPNLFLLKKWAVDSISLMRSVQGIVSVPVMGEDV